MKCCEQKHENKAKSAWMLTVRLVSTLKKPLHMFVLLFVIKVMRWAPTISLNLFDIKKASKRIGIRSYPDLSLETLTCQSRPIENSIYRGLYRLSATKATKRIEERASYNFSSFFIPSFGTNSTGRDWALAPMFGTGNEEGLLSHVVWLRWVEILHISPSNSVEFRF